jgi:hypothetical protein
LKIILQKILLFYWFLMPCLGFAKQNTPILDRLITVRITNERMADALDMIAKQGNFNFVYNTNLVEINRRVDLVAINRPVRDVLGQLLKNAPLRYKAKDSYVLLLKGEVEKPQNLYVMGYVFDKQTGNRLSNVSIYERTSLASAVTNQYGYFRIRLPADRLPARIIASKPEYQQEAILVKNTSTESLDIQLIARDLPLEKPTQIDVIEIKQKNIILSDTVEKNPLKNTIVLTPEPNTPNPLVKNLNYGKSIKDQYQKIKSGFVNFFISGKQKVHTRNISDTLHRQVQLSLLPFIGTNHTLSGNIENDYSINLIAGYSSGVRKAEFGGVLNAVRFDVNGFQASGVGNIVGGNTDGLQLAGVFNTDFGDFKGIQASGVFNQNWQNFNGMQYSGSVNIVHKNLSGVQLSGVVNLAGSVEKGGQISTVNTVLKTLNGIQIGVLNYATRVGQKGKQVGIVNVADSSAAVPIGLISFVRKGGYKRFEISADENLILNLVYKTGVPRFYNIFSLGLGGNNIAQEKYIGYSGYGVGMARNWGRNWMVNLDFTGSVIAEIDNSTINYGTLYRFDVGFEKRISKFAAITFGPSLKTLWIDYEETPYTGAKPFRGVPSYPTIAANRNFTLWLGLQAGLRFGKK